MNYKLVDSRFIKNGDINIHYKTLGNPENPPILFNHGNGNCIDDWFSLSYLDKLYKDYYLILVDGRGYGKSDKPHESKFYTIELITQDFICVLNALGIKKCHYFGNSRGGSMGFSFAQLYPEYFLSYTLCSAQPFGSKGPRLSEQFIVWLDNGIDFFVKEVEKALGKSFPKDVKENFLKNDPKAMIAANALPWPDHSESFNSPEVTSCHLIVGEKDPIVSSNVEYLKHMKNKSKIKLTILQDLGHAEVYWDSDKIVPLLRETIQSNCEGCASSSSVLISNLKYR